MLPTQENKKSVFFRTAPVFRSLVLLSQKGLIVDKVFSEQSLPLSSAETNDLTIFRSNTKKRNSSLRVPTLNVNQLINRSYLVNIKIFYGNTFKFLSLLTIIAISIYI